MATQDQKARMEMYEARAKAYQRVWATDLMGTTGASPGYCCYSIWCPWCASYQLRKRALYGDMSRYLCCAGYLPCSGRCGEAKCPSCCLCLEVCICFSQSVASTRWMLQDEMHLSNTKCDNCIIATTVFFQYLSCIFSCIAICVDGMQEAACILDYVADCMWCSMCACMQTQHKLQLDARDRDPSLVQPLHPFMAPVQQQMHFVPPKGQPAGTPPPVQGYQPPPGQAYPPPPAGYPVRQ